MLNESSTFILNQIKNGYTNSILIKHCNLRCNVSVQRRPDSSSTFVLSILLHSHLCDGRIFYLSNVIVNMNSRTFKETLVRLDDIKRFMKKYA